MVTSVSTSANASLAMEVVALTTAVCGLYRVGPTSQSVAWSPVGSSDLPHGLSLFSALLCWHVASCGCTMSPSLCLHAMTKIWSSKRRW